MVNIVTALAYHYFCLALPAAFTQPGDHLLAESCTEDSYFIQVIGIDDICGFGFMDPPWPADVDHALGCLHELGALANDMAVTDLGFKMAEFPLVPNLAKVLLVAAGMECSDEVHLSSTNYITRFYTLAQCNRC